MKKEKKIEEEIMEKLADIEHQRWADWQKWCHKILRENCPSPELEKVLKRWDKQIATPYSELSEKEKESDREQVRRYLPILSQTLTQIRREERDKLGREMYKVMEKKTQKAKEETIDSVIEVLKERKTPEIECFCEELDWWKEKRGTDSQLYNEGYDQALSDAIEEIKSLK